MSTIFALSTAYQKSAIAIIRVSGPKAYESALQITGKASLTPNKATLCILYNNFYTQKNNNTEKNQKIDEAVVMYFKAPNSYTGEDLVEYHIHGSLAVIKELLELLYTKDEHKMAERGEFTKRALINGKVDILKAESINDLINAETKQQQKQAIFSMLGGAHSVYKNYEEQIKEILALSETTIDFSDQDIDDDLFTYINNKLENLITSIDKNITNLAGVQKLKQGISIAILGEPNVGKSSLINFLTKQNIAIVSPIAGTTRDVIESNIDFHGFAINIADTAGLRENTTDIIEQEGIKRAKEKIANADIKIIMLDVSNINNTSIEILNYIDENSIVLVNKLDIFANNLNNTNYKQISKDFLQNNANQKLNTQNTVIASINSNTGLDVFSNILIQKLHNITKILENPVITQQRHQQIMNQVLLELKNAQSVKTEIVLCAFHLRSALTHLGAITGKTNIEDILDIIFSKFCIGK
jgi:tRNA modification GTPase